METTSFYNEHEISVPHFDEIWVAQGRPHHILIGYEPKIIEDHYRWN